MILAQPVENDRVEFAGKAAKLVGLGLADGVGDIVFGSVAFGTAGVQVVGIVRAVGSKDDGQRLQSAVVGQIFRRPIAAGIQQDSTELEGRVVGDAKLPIWRKIACGIVEITFDNSKQIGDLLPGYLGSLTFTAVDADLALKASL